MSEHEGVVTLSAETAPRFDGERLDRKRYGLMIGGVGALALSLLGLFSDVQQLLLSYLTAYLFVLSIALGALFFVLVHHLSRAGWSVTVRRLAEGLSTSSGCTRFSIGPTPRLLRATTCSRTRSRI